MTAFVFISFTTWANQYLPILVYQTAIGFLLLLLSALFLKPQFLVSQAPQGSR